MVYVPEAGIPSWHGPVATLPVPSPNATVRTVRSDLERVPRRASSPAGRGRASWRSVCASPRLRRNGATPTDGCPAAPARSREPVRDCFRVQTAERAEFAQCEDELLVEKYARGIHYFSPTHCRTSVLSRVRGPNATSRSCAQEVRASSVSARGACFSSTAR